MGNNEHEQSTYKRVKRDFEQMRLEERASFIVEATAATILEGARRASESLAREVDQWAKPRDTSDKSDPDAPGPAEPESTTHPD